MKTAVLIPAYEPDEKLIALLKALRDGTDYEIVVIDDGSGAAFQQFFAEAAAFGTVLTHSENRGKGAALKTGISELLEHSEAEAVVTVDADGQHRVEDAKRVVEALENAKARTLVLGERHFTGNVPFRSKLGNAVSRLIFRFATGEKVYDTQTGLRAFRRELFEEFLTIPGDRYEYEMNMLLACSRMEVGISGIPIETLYIDGNKSSHYRAVADTFRIFKGILMFSASSVISFLIDFLLFFGLTKLLGTDTALKLSACNVIARVFSSTANFCINRNLVFRQKGNLWKSLLEYYVLAAGVLIGNTLILNCLTGVLGLNELLAKIIAEIVMFLVSWVVQRFVIFKKQA